VPKLRFLDLVFPLSPVLKLMSGFYDGEAWFYP